MQEGGTRCNCIKKGHQEAEGMEARGKTHGVASPPGRVLESLACRASLSEASGKGSMARDLGLKTGRVPTPNPFFFT